MSDDQLGVQVSLTSIYSHVMDTKTKVTQLEHAVNELVAVNKRLDGHRDDIESHSDRLRKLEAQVASQWVIVSVVIVVIGAAVVRALFPSM